LCCLGRHTITGLLSTSGSQFHDWSAAYRLFSHHRLHPQALFHGIRRAAIDSLPAAAPLCISMDDSVLRKTGSKIHGVAWRRDPLSPPFHVNFIRAQRVLQLSLAVPDGLHPRSVRMIPIDFAHVPTLPRPHKKAPVAQWEQYKQAQKQANLSIQALGRLQAVNQDLQPLLQAQSRRVFMLTDNRFTNKSVCRGLPAGFTLIGRVRKDTKLFFPPTADQQRARGRRLLYGTIAPTPEQLRQDDSVEWSPVKVFAAGAERECRVKRIGPVLWRTIGAAQPLQLVVIAPLGVRLRKGGKVTYREPAYLICTDPTVAVADILQQYIWRWDIEVNFRDEKTLLGAGEAQVRTPASTEAVPALIVAAYAMLLLASRQVGGRSESLPPPKWRAQRKPQRESTQHIVNQLRSELWGRALGLDNFSDFSSPAPADVNPEKLATSLPSAVLYCTL